MSFKIVTNALEEDPFVLVESLEKKRAFLFDCGLKVRGNYRRLRKLNAIFLTHSHIDHLIGFDHILRSMLSETTALDIYGPKDFIGKMTGRILSYDWDRAHEQNLTLRIREIDGANISSVSMSSHRHFKPEQTRDQLSAESLCYGNEFSVEWAPLDHGGSPCLGYAIRSRDRWRINKDIFQLEGLSEGPWVGRLLRQLEDGSCCVDLGPGAPDWTVSDLKQRIAYFQVGKKVAYVTDTKFTGPVRDNVQRLADGADLLICEGTFTSADQAAAKRFNHLTAQEAAQLARLANVKRLLLNHPSRRYHGQFHLLLNEAREIFPDTGMVGYRGERINL